MKFLDFTSLLDTEPANLAALSTFQFDADFFERRLLRCSALLKARRILVFMDASQWFNLLRQDVPARFLNRRYLVVPVRPAEGSLSPKAEPAGQGGWRSGPLREQQPHSFGMRQQSGTAELVLHHPGERERGSGEACSRSVCVLQAGLRRRRSGDRPHCPPVA